MFYSQLPELIDTNNSFLDPRRVFTGQYWDEFALTNYLVPKNAEVLMLGLSAGGGVRPLLASDNNLHLTCVEIDQATSLQFQSYFARHFPELQPTVETADAQEFLKATERIFDCIWLDIYESDRYCKIVVDPSFHRLISSRLKPHGVLMVNSYGLPNQFKPLARPGIQTRLAHTLLDVFPFVSAIPFRRNLTMIASREQPTIHDIKPHQKLSARDKAALSFMKLKLGNLHALKTEELATISTESTPDEEGKFPVIDHEMRSSWAEVIETLSRYNVHLSSTQDLLSFIQDEAACEKVLNEAIDKRDFKIAFVSILAAGESNFRDLDVGWLFTWTLANRARFSDSLPELFHNIWIPQLIALFLQVGKYSSYYFELAEMVRTELK